MSLQRYGFIRFGDTEIAIKTTGFNKRRMVLKELKSNLNLPTKPSTPNEQERKAFESFGYKENPAMPVMIARINETSKEYIQFQNKLDSYNLFVKIATNIDLDYIYSEIPMWEELELKSNTDYIGALNWIQNLDMGEFDYERIDKTIDLIQNSTIKSYDEWKERVSGNNEDKGI